MTPQRFFVGDGILWVVYSEGGAAMLAQSDADFKPTMAVVMLAITMQKGVVVRYLADGLNCANPPGVQEIAGIWLAR